MPEIIDVHTHFGGPNLAERFGLGNVFNAERVKGKVVTNYRGLPAVTYAAGVSFQEQQEVCEKAGITRRMMSNSFAVEVFSRETTKPSIEAAKFCNDDIANTVSMAPKGTMWGIGGINPLEKSHVKEAERCIDRLGFKAIQSNSSWHGRFIDTDESYPFWEWAEDRKVPIFLHPPRVPIGHDQQMGQYKLDELVGRPFDTAMSVARMILSGLFDRFPNLRILVAHMGGGLLPCMGRLDFGWRLGFEGLPEHTVARCQRLPSDYLRTNLIVDTMGFWAPHVKEAVEVFGADNVMFGTDYGPVPLDPREHIDIVNALDVSPADKENILWRNADSYFGLGIKRLQIDQNL